MKCKIFALPQTGPSRTAVHSSPATSTHNEFSPKSSNAIGSNFLKNKKKNQGLLYVQLLLFFGWRNATFFSHSYFSFTSVSFYPCVPTTAAPLLWVSASSLIQTLRLSLHQHKPHNHNMSVHSILYQNHTFSVHS